MADPCRFTEAELLDLAGRAIGRIDARGRRGAEQATDEEIVAMALLLALLGVPSIPPSTPGSKGATT